MKEPGKQARDNEADHVKSELDQLLHDALMQTFPCSDPIALSPPESGGHPSEENLAAQRILGRNRAIASRAASPISGS